MERGEDASPFRSTWRFDQWGHSLSVQWLRFAEVDNVENDSLKGKWELKLGNLDDDKNEFSACFWQKVNSHLIGFDIFNSEVEPNPEARVTGVWPDEQVVLVIRNVIDPAKVPCKKQIGLEVTVARSQRLLETFVNRCPFLDSQLISESHDQIVLLFEGEPKAQMSFSHHFQSRHQRSNVPVWASQNSQAEPHKICSRFQPLALHCLRCHFLQKNRNENFIKLFETVPWGKRKHILAS